MRIFSNFCANHYLKNKEENHEDTLANVQKRPLSNERKTFM